MTGGEVGALRRWALSRAAAWARVRASPWAPIAAKVTAALSAVSFLALVATALPSTGGRALAAAGVTDPAVAPAAAPLSFEGGAPFAVAPATGPPPPSPSTADDGRNAATPRTEGRHPATPADPVPLNVASVDELQRLPGIGPKRAKAIFDLRARLGRFRQVDDLLRVKGLGRATLRTIRPLVRLDPESAATAAGVMTSADAGARPPA